jgi:hypothetical protein
MDTKEVTEKLKNAHDPKEWAVFQELKIGAGLDKSVMQRFDLWVVNYYRSKRYMTRCYEVKVSRSDFLKEINTPLKRRAGLRLSNEFYFVTPKGLLDIMEIPVECGLLEVGDDGSIEQTVPAPFRDIMPLPNSLVAAISRRADKDRLKDWTLNHATPKKINKAAMAVLSHHIDKWKNYSHGNKEVPDQIANALRDVYYDIVEALNSDKVDI